MTLGQALQREVFCSRTQKGSLYGDMELLMSHVLKCKRFQIYTRWDSPLDVKSQKFFTRLAARRVQGVPLAYLLKSCEFYGRSFYVEEGVFIPRPDTETLIRAVKKQTGFFPSVPLCIVDLGSGSGCIGLSLLKEYPLARGFLVDVCEKALRVSRVNAEKWKLAGRVRFLKKDAGALKGSDGAGFLPPGGVDMVVSNPPYIAFHDHRLAREVCHFEPARALFSPQGGLYHICSWFRAACDMLKPGGHYFFEIGAGQDVSHLKKGCSVMKWVNVYKDLSGHNRVMHFQKSYG